MVGNGIEKAGVKPQNTRKSYVTYQGDGERRIPCASVLKTIYPLGELSVLIICLFFHAFEEEHIKIEGR